MTHTIDPFDEVAAMFLTEPDAAGTAVGPVSETGAPLPPEQPSPATGLIELLIVGHLPVRAGLWVTPYADAVARMAGTTALVRLDGDEPMIQVLRGRHEIDETTGRETGGLPPSRVCRSLRETILHLGSSIRMWIVRPSSQLETHELLATDEPNGGSFDGEGRREPLADRITILSSADQAALVNTYRMIKDLAVGARVSGAALPSIGLAMVGRDRDDAARVAAQVGRTSREHLDIDVPLVLCLPRIDASINASSLRSFPGQARPSLDAVIGWIDEAKRRGEDASGTREATTPMTPTPPPLHSTSTPHSTHQPGLPPSPRRPVEVEAREDERILRAEDVAHEPRPGGVREIDRAEHARGASVDETRSEGRYAPWSGRVALRPQHRSPAPRPEWPDRRVDLEPGGQDVQDAPGAPGARTEAGIEADAAADMDVMGVTGVMGGDLADLIASGGSTGGSAAVAPSSTERPPSGRPAAAPIDSAAAPRTTIHRTSSTIELEPKSPTGASEPELDGWPVLLANHVTRKVPLVPIAPRCPGHERVELAVDETGCVHLLGRDDVLRDMSVVDAWTHAHRELIAMACPEVRFDPRGRVVCHLFTQEPIRVADLHGSRLHLHVLTPVDVDDQRAWYAAPLNRPPR